jgi:hypothetical protein
MRYQPTVVVSRYKIGPLPKWVVDFILVIVMSFISDVSWLILPVVSLVEGWGHSIVVSWQTIAVSAICGRVGHGRGWVWHSKPDTGYLVGWVDIWLSDRRRAPVTVEAMRGLPIIRVGGGCGVWCVSRGGIWCVSRRGIWCLRGRCIWCLRGGANKCSGDWEGRHRRVVSESTCLSRRHWSSVASPDALVGRFTGTTAGGAWGCLFLLSLGLLQVFKLLLKILQWKLGL